MSPWYADVVSPIFSKTYQSQGPDHKLTHRCELVVNSVDWGLHHVASSHYCANGACHYVFLAFASVAQKYGCETSKHPAVKAAKKDACRMMLEWESFDPSFLSGATTRGQFISQSSQQNGLAKKTKSPFRNTFCEQVRGARRGQSRRRGDAGQRGAEDAAGDAQPPREHDDLRNRPDLRKTMHARDTASWGELLYK